MIAAANRDVRPIVVATRISLIDPPDCVIFFDTPAEEPSPALQRPTAQHRAKTKMRILVLLY
jgi:hypothetical protein